MEKQELQLALLMDFENLVIGLENNEPDVERPFAMDDIIRFLEQQYGRVVYRKAFADWSNSKFRKYGQDLMRSGVEMQHVVRVGYNAKSTADTFLVLQAMDCVLHYPAISMYVLVTGDADFLPLISRLKATGRKVVGLGTEGTIANTLIQNCDEYIYYGSDGLRLQAKTLVDKTPVINALRKILSSRDYSLPALAEQLTRLLPDFSPTAYGNHDLQDFLRSIAPFVRLVQGSDGLWAQWVGNRRNGSRQQSAQALEDYLRATRWYILDGTVRDRVLRDIYAAMMDKNEAFLGEELRNRIDPGHEIEERTWYGTILSLLYGYCLWENPETADEAMQQRQISLHRSVRSEEDFLLRYYASLFHKAFTERPELSAQAMAELMHPDDVAGHLDFFEQVMQVLKSRH
ncbi:MAG: NYN domain-containing protein [Lentisphaeria bacterium]|jgi:uncharacterized protein (TIGR00288 family)